jgi:DnaJ-class molecular chaperone
MKKEKPIINFWDINGAGCGYLSVKKDSESKSVLEQMVKDEKAELRDDDETCYGVVFENSFRNHVRVRNWCTTCKGTGKVRQWPIQESLICPVCKGKQWYIE